MIQLSNLIATFEKDKGRRDYLQGHLQDVDYKLTNLRAREVSLLKAKQLIYDVTKEIHTQLEWHVSHVVTLALESIWDDPYTFHLEFTSRANRTECDLFLSKQGQKVELLDATGGGVVDVVSMMLTIAFWSLNKNRNTLMFDEPTKFLHSPKLQQRCSDLLQTICDRLSVQIIIISDQESMAQSADRVFTAVHDGTKTVITTKEE